MHSPARPLAQRGLNCRKAPFLCDPNVTSVAATRAMPCKLWDCKKVPNTWVADAVASHFLKEPILAHPHSAWMIKVLVMGSQDF